MAAVAFWSSSVEKVVHDLMLCFVLNDQCNSELLYFHRSN